MSATVVFYYLKEPQHNGKLRLTCNLANTAFKKGHKVYIAAANEQLCGLLDDLLWTFAPNSFVPHTVYVENRITDLEKFPVVIGSASPSDQFSDVLISLHEEVPDFASQFQRVIEPVDSIDSDIEKAKIKYDRYTALFDAEPIAHHL